MQDFLTFHEKFSDEDFEAQYNLRLGRPDYEETVIPDWTVRSDKAKSETDCTLDIRYAEGEKQKLEILKQLYLGRKFLILDEPTSVLTPDEADEVLGHVAALCKAGRSRC